MSVDFPFCPKCGQKNHRDNPFCKKCGARLDDDGIRLETEIARVKLKKTVDPYLIEEHAKSLFERREELEKKRAGEKKNKDSIKKLPAPCRQKSDSLPMIVFFLLVFAAVVIAYSNRTGTPVAKVLMLDRLGVMLPGNSPNPPVEDSPETPAESSLPHNSPDSAIPQTSQPDPETPGEEIPEIADYQVHGIMKADHRIYAILTKNGRSFDVSRGTKLPDGWIVDKIALDRVILKKEKVYQTITLEKEGNREPAPPRKPAVSEIPSGDWDEKNPPGVINEEPEV